MIGVELKVADGVNLTIGQDFVVKATVTNKSSKARYVFLSARREVMCGIFTLLLSCDTGL